jgi:hypothetical protein
MRVVPTIVVAASLPANTGCSQIEKWQMPEVVACESALVNTLKSPSSYKRIKVHKGDEKVSKQEWLALSLSGAAMNLSGAADKNSKDDVLREYANQELERALKQGGKRIVGLEYDAVNSYNASIRGYSECTFMMKSFADNEFDQDPESAAGIFGKQSEDGELECCTRR